MPPAARVRSEAAFYLCNKKTGPDMVRRILKTYRNKSQFCTVSRKIPLYLQFSVLLPERFGAGSDPARCTFGTRFVRDSPEPRSICSPQRFRYLRVLFLRCTHRAFLQTSIRMYVIVTYWLCQIVQFPELDTSDSTLSIL